MTTSTDIANQAIAMMGNNQPPVTGVAPTFDDSTAGKVLRYLYVPCVAQVVRQFEYDFARNTVELELTSNLAPEPWALEYVYPSSAVEIWQLMPPELDDRSNPSPVNWVVANNTVSGSQARVIHTNVANALAVVNNNPNENTWDASFREAVVRLLASELAIATAGKPETSTVLLQSASQFAQVSRTRGG